MEYLTICKGGFPYFLGGNPYFFMKQHNGQENREQQHFHPPDTGVELLVPLRQRGLRVVVVEYLFIAVSLSSHHGGSYLA